MTTNALQSTSWLAKRLGLSVSTIERLRAHGKGELPPHIMIGLHTIRHDEAVVEAWLSAQQGYRDAATTMVQSCPAPTPKIRFLGKRLLTAATTS